MRKSTLWTTALALFSTLALTALPAAAQTPDQPAAEMSAVAPQSAPAAAPLQVEPAPIEQAKPLKCGPHEHEFSTIYLIFPSTEDCEAACTSYCQDNGGYLLSWYFYLRSLSCSCTCCG